VRGISTGETAFDAVVTTYEMLKSSQHALNRVVRASSTILLLHNPPTINATTAVLVSAVDCRRVSHNRHFSHNHDLVCQFECA
jgi:hypothetical protein